MSQWWNQQTQENSQWSSGQNGKSGGENLLHEWLDFIHDNSASQAESGLPCTKSRSVDQILARSRQGATLAPLAVSADNLSTNVARSASNRSFVTSGLQLSAVSSNSTAPMPDISGEPGLILTVCVSLHFTLTLCTDLLSSAHVLSKIILMDRALG